MATLTVGWDENGVAQDYSSISSAISASSDGDQIHLYYSASNKLSTYYNEFRSTSKRLSFIGKTTTGRKAGLGSLTLTPTLTADIELTDITASGDITITTQSGSTANILIQRCQSITGSIDVDLTNGGTCDAKSCLSIYSADFGFLGRAGYEINTYNCTSIGARLQNFLDCNMDSCISLEGVGTNGVFRCSAKYSIIDTNSSLTDLGNNILSPQPTSKTVKLSSENWRMQLDSPYIASGNSTAETPSVDFYGNTYGSPPSIGADAGAAVVLDGDIILDTASGGNSQGNWTKADKTKVQEGNDFGVSGSEVAALDNDNILSTVTGGNWNDIPEADVKLGEQWGVGGTSRTGTYNPANAATIITLSEDQIYWEPQSDGVLIPRAQELDLNYPTEPQVQQDVVFGYLNQYTGQLNASGGGVIPTAPTVQVQDNQDGTSATVTVSNSDTGASNRVYVFRRNRGVMELTLATTIIGNGSDTYSGAVGEYIAFVVPESTDNLYGIPSDPDSFWISNQTDYLIRDEVSEVAASLLSGLIVSGIQIGFTNVDEAEVEIWASLDSGSGVTQLKRSIETDTTSLQFTIPRQTGFPPSEFKPGAWVTYDSIDYEINTVEYSNGLPELSAAFIISVDRFNRHGNY